VARIRYLKPEYFTDEDLAEHPIWVRYLFAGLWNHADRDGRLEDRPKFLKSQIFPYDDHDVDAGLIELARPKAASGKPFLIRYQFDGQRYIFNLDSKVLAKGVWRAHAKLDDGTDHTVLLEFK